MATVPSSQNSAQVPKEKNRFFSQANFLQLSLLNIVVGARSILETETFSDGSVWAAHFTKTANELQNQHFGSVNIGIPAPIIYDNTDLLRQNLQFWLFSV